eukprot:g18736.t1
MFSHGRFMFSLSGFGRTPEFAPALAQFLRKAGSFVKGKPKVNRWKTSKQIPVVTKEAIAMSKELKRRNFGFVGPTVCYALMQSVGMVNDHPVNTPQWKRVNAIVERRFG